MEQGATLNIGEGSSVTFNGSTAVQTGGTINVELGASILVGAYQTVNDGGTISFGTGDAVTFGTAYNSSTQVFVGNGGLLSATGTTFASNGGNFTQIQVNSGGELRASDSSFSLSQLSLTAGSVLESGDLSADVFALPIYVPDQDIPLLTDNQSFEDINILDDDFGGSLALDLIGTVSTSGLVYVFPYGFTVDPGGSIDVAANVSVFIGAYQTVNDGGTISFGTGDAVTFGTAYNSSTQVFVGNGGLLSATGTTFASNGGNFTQIQVNSGGELRASDSSFSLSQLSLTAGSVLESGDLSADVFALPIYVPDQDIPLLTDNQSFEDINILDDDFGGSLALDLIGTVSTSGLVYVFPYGFTVDPGGSIDVAANVSVFIGAYQTVNDGGTISFGTGDAVTFGTAYNSSTLLLVNNGGVLIANDMTVAATGGNFTQVEVDSGADFTLTDSTYGLTNLTLNSGSTATLDTDVLSGVFTINSNTTLNVTGNDFSNLTNPDGLVAAGDPSATINVSGNYWGTNVAGIDAIILDHNDNSALPTVNFQPYVQYSSGTSADPQEITFSPGPNSPSFQLTADVYTSAGLVINEGTESFTILDGTTPLGEITSAPVENGSVTVTYTTLPPDTPAGLYTIEAEFSDDGLNNYLPATDTSHFLIIDPASTTTTVNSASATYSDVSDQSIPLSAQVSSGAGTVDEGTVTFTILSGGNPVGGAVSAAVVSGVADTNYDLVSGTAGDSYAIEAVYTDPLDFTTSSGSNILTVSAAATTTTATGASTSYNPSAGEPVTLSARVTSPAGTINEGSVTFAVVNSSDVMILSNVYADVDDGSASVDVLLPAGTAVGLDTIEAVYNGTASFAQSLPSDTSLIVDPGTTITTASSASTPFSESPQTVTLDAEVTSGGFAVDEGTVTFTILSGSAIVGSPVSMTIGAGMATVAYSIPAGEATGVYIVQAVYDDSGTGNFLNSTDTSHFLTITEPPAYQLVIVTEPPSSPTTVTAGQLFDPQPVIYVEDQYGDLETGDNSTVVTAAFGSGLGTFTATVAGGIATFNNVVDDKAETTTLEFTSGSLLAATSSQIVVVPTAASQLVVTQQPSPTATAGVAFSTEPIVAEEDAFGNVITTDNTSTVTAVRGSVGTGNLMGSNLTVTLTDGMAAYGGLSYTTAELMNISFSTDAAGVSSVSSNDVLVNPSSATQLIINQQPSSTANAGQPFLTQPVVYEEDQYGNVETGDNDKVVSAMLYTGVGPLAGTLNAIVSDGVARFSALADQTAETLRLEFVSGTLYSAPTSAIVVSPAAVNKLIVVTEPPANATAGQAFALQPVVEVADQYGNLETDDNSTQVSVTSSGSGTLLGSSTVTVSGGLATFTGLQDNTAETLTLSFTDGVLTPIASGPVAVAPGATATLAVTRMPKGVVMAGMKFAFTIDAEDRYGNATPSFTGEVSAVLASGPGSLGGTTVMAAANGEADFTDLYTTTTGSITLSASGTTEGGTNITAPATPSIPVGPGKPAQLVIVQEPSSPETAGVAFATQPVIDEEDAYGNLETSDSATDVTVSSNGAGQLQGSTIVVVQGGVATFSGLLDDTAETISLDFSSTNLTAVLSTPVAIGPAALDHIVIHRQPSSAATAGQAFGTQPVIYEEDRFNNIETGDNSTQVVAALASGTGPLQGTATVTVRGGIATFATLADDLAETVTLDFSVPDSSFTAGSSENIVVSAGPAAKLVIDVQPPSSATAGNVFSSNTVVFEEDAYGNIDKTDNSTVITAAPSVGAAALQGTQATVKAGVATFTGLIDDTAGSVELQFTAGASTSLASIPILVAPAALDQLSIYSQPPSPTIAGQPFGAVIREEDKFGNLLTTDNATQITAVLADGADDLTGTTVATVSGGVATFSNLIDDTAETITLNFSGGGLTNGPSTDVVVNPAAAALLVIKTEPPQSMQAGQTFGAVIWEEDQFHNLETTDSSTQVTASLDSGVGPLQGAGSPVTLDDGVATFTTLADDTAETIKLGFSTSALTAGPSDSVVVTAGADDKLVISEQPSSTASAGQAFANQPVVYVEDQFGNIETGDNTTTVSVAINGGSSILQNGSPVTVQQGVARFSGLAYDLAQTIALRFTSNGLNSPTSNTIAVIPGLASKLVVLTQPSPKATAGVAFATEPVVIEEDAFGNRETNDNSTPVSVSLNSGTGPLQGILTTNFAGGVATFSGLGDTIAETITLRFTSGNEAPALSNAINVLPTVSIPLPPPSVSRPKIIGESMTFAPKSKKGKKTANGIQLEFDSPMNQGSLLNSANYTLLANVKKGKKTTTTVVAITSISASSTSVILNFATKQKFRLGGTLTLDNPASGGIVGLYGLGLKLSYTFTISPNAKDIS